MKNLIKSFLILIAIALFAFAFNFNDNSAGSAENHDCPGFDVTVVGSNGGFNITVYKNGNPIQTGCYTGEGKFHCCVNMANYTSGDYDVCADNGLCQGCTYSVYWPGLPDSNIPVTVDVRAGCYK